MLRRTSRAALPFKPPEVVEQECACECEIFDLNCICSCVKISCERIDNLAYEKFKSLLTKILGNECTCDLYDSIKKAKAEARDANDRDWTAYVKGKWKPLFKGGCCNEFKKFYCWTVAKFHYQLGQEYIDTGISGGSVKASLRVMKSAKLDFIRPEAAYWQADFESRAGCFNCCPPKRFNIFNC